MPSIDTDLLVPTGPLHWTSIMHYIVLLSTLFILVTSGGKTNLFYIMILATLALLTAADLYIDRIQVNRLFIFLIRVLILGIPIILAGISPSDQTRSASGLTAFLASPILIITFFNCLLPTFLADPRILRWC